MSKGIKKYNRFLNYLLFIQLLLFLIIIALFILIPIDVEKSSQNILVSDYGDGLVGMSIDECISVLGEPYAISDSEAYFDGGYEVCQMLTYGEYIQYELEVHFDENGIVEYAYNSGTVLPIEHYHNYDLY